MINWPEWTTTRNDLYEAERIASLFNDAGMRVSLVANIRGN